METNEIKQKYLYELENDFKGILETTKRNQQGEFNLFMLGLKQLDYKGLSLNWFLNILREDKQQITKSKRIKLNRLLYGCEFITPQYYNREVIRKRLNEMNEYRTRGGFIMYEFI